jgi:hypothetical protein
MKTTPFSASRLPRPALALAAVAALLILSACGSMSTIEGRSKEKSAAFTTAAPWQQKLMREGWIDIGFSTDMVYVALDNPDKKIPTTDGEREVWVYNNFNSTEHAFGGGVKISIQAGSALGGQGINPNSQAAKGLYTSAAVTPDLGNATEVEPVSRLYIRFLHGKVDHVEMRKE